MTESKVEMHAREKKRREQERCKMMAEAFTFKHMTEGFGEIPEDIYATMQHKLQEAEEDEKMMMEIEQGDVVNEKDHSATTQWVSAEKQTTDANYIGAKDGKDNDESSKASAFRTDHLVRILAKVHKTMLETRDAIFTLCTLAQDKDEREEARDEKATEWHQVAVALDRTFFFLYLACLIVLAIVSSAILFPRAI